MEIVTTRYGPACDIHIFVCVRESATTRCGPVYNILCSPHIRHRGTPRGYIEHVIQQRIKTVVSPHMTYKYHHSDPKCEDSLSEGGRFEAGLTSKRYKSGLKLKDI